MFLVTNYFKVFYNHLDFPLPIMKLQNFVKQNSKLTWQECSKIFRAELFYAQWYIISWHYWRFSWCLFPWMFSVSNSFLKIIKIPYKRCCVLKSLKLLLALRLLISAIFEIAQPFFFSEKWCAKSFIIFFLQFIIIWSHCITRTLRLPLQGVYLSYVCVSWTLL